MSVKKRITILAIAVINAVIPQEIQAAEPLIIDAGALAAIPKPKKLSDLTKVAAETIAIVSRVGGRIGNLFPDVLTLNPNDAQVIANITDFFAVEPPDYESLGRGALVATQLNSLIKEKAVQTLYGETDEWRYKLVLGTQKVTDLTYFVQYMVGKQPRLIFWNFLKVVNKVTDEFHHGSVSQRIASVLKSEQEQGMPASVLHDLEMLNRILPQVVTNQEPMELRLRQFTPFI